MVIVMVYEVNGEYGGQRESSQRYEDDSVSGVTGGRSGGGYVENRTVIEESDKLGVSQCSGLITNCQNDTECRWAFYAVCPESSVVL